MEERVAALLREGQAVARAGRKAEARRRFRAALRLDPDNTAALLWLAWLSGDPRAALAYAERALARAPGNPHARAALAWARRRVELALNPSIPFGTDADQGSAARGSALSEGEGSPIRREPQPLPARPARHRRWPRTVGVAALCLLAALIGGILARSLPPDPTAMAEAVTVPVVTATPTATMSPTPAPPPTAIPSPIPTWTPTPTPLPTPISSPTATPPPVTPTEPVTLIPATLVPLHVQAASDEHWIEVDLSDQTLNAYEGRKLVRTTLVSTGLPRTSTPIGTFRIHTKLRYDDMSGADYYLANVPYVMYFHRGYALHGTYWHTNFGRPASHGCVNIPPEHAEWLFSWAEVGTVVHIHE